MTETLIFNTETQELKNQDGPLPIYGEMHPLLKIKIPEYSNGFPSPILERLANRLVMTRKLYGGIGLSANQCGVSERIFVIGTDSYDMICVNPRVVAQSDELSKTQEGCLSFPGLVLSMERPESIDVEYTTPQGQVQNARLSGITARCFLHELDHLNGIRFIDRVGKASLQIARQRQAKLLKKMKKKKRA
jgi:peptide deformylase